MVTLDVEVSEVVPEATGELVGLASLRPKGETFVAGPEEMKPLAEKKSSFAGSS